MRAKLSELKRLVPFAWGNQLARNAAGLPKLKTPGGVVDEPHPEYVAQKLRWLWLLDSWEGGEAYRQAVYAYDTNGMPVRNLIRHKREYPGPYETAAGDLGRAIGTDQAATATDDDYELRRARTPVPSFLADAIKAHLSRIYCREVKRTGPAELKAFWDDPTGRGEGPIDVWFPAAVAPLLLTLGQLDFLVERPPAPAGVTIRSRSDEAAHGINRALARIVLPFDIPWWRLDAYGRYAEVVVRETSPAGEAWRYWDATQWVLFDANGNRVGEKDHPYGRPPLARVFDRRRPRDENTGLPRYEVVAELQREFYNRDSELILSDTTQAHPLIQGPGDYVDEEGTVPIGPSWMLPKLRLQDGSGYEGFDVLAFPKDGADSLRQNKADLRDAVDRAALLVKPAGSSGTNGNTVSQSGASKRIDQSSGHDQLADIATVLARAENTLAELAVLAINAGPPATRPAKPPVQYPKSFDLFTAPELATIAADFQGLVRDSGQLPKVEIGLLSRLVRLMSPGLEDAEYRGFDAEIAERVEANATAAKQRDEAGPIDPDETPDEGRPAEPSGQPTSPE